MLRQNLLKLPNNIFRGKSFSDSRSFTCEETDMHAKADGSITVLAIHRCQKLTGPSFSVV